MNWTIRQIERDIETVNDLFDFDVVPAPTPQPTAREARKHPDARDAERQNRRAMRSRKGR
jgi:hypothetical protein